MRGYIALLNYYFKNPFDGGFLGIHVGEVVTYSLFMAQLPEGMTAFTPAPTETIGGLQAGYSLRFENKIALGLGARGSFYGESNAFAFSPAMTLGITFE